MKENNVNIFLSMYVWCTWGPWGEGISQGSPPS